MLTIVFFIDNVLIDPIILCRNYFMRLEHKRHFLLCYIHAKNTSLSSIYISRHFFRFNTIVIILIKVRTRKIDYTYTYMALNRDKIKNANLLRFVIYIFVHLKITMIRSEHRTFMYV